MRSNGTRMEDLPYSVDYVDTFEIDGDSHFTQARFATEKEAITIARAYARFFAWDATLSRGCGNEMPKNARLVENTFADFISVYGPNFEPLYCSDDDPSVLEFPSKEDLELLTAHLDTFKTADLVRFWRAFDFYQRCGLR
jgi:hypothetical protein